MEVVGGGRKKKKGGTGSSRLDVPQSRRLMTLTVTVTEPEDASGVCLTEAVILPQEAHTLTTKPNTCTYPYFIRFLLVYLVLLMVKVKGPSKCLVCNADWVGALILSSYPEKALRRCKVQCH